MKYITTRHAIGEPFEAPSSIAGVEIKCAPIYEHILIDPSMQDTYGVDCSRSNFAEAEIIVVWRILEK